MKYLKRLSPTGRDSGGQQLAIPREVSAIWADPRRVACEFRDGVLTIEPISDDE